MRAADVECVVLNPSALVKVEYLELGMVTILVSKDGDLSLQWVGRFRSEDDGRLQSVRPNLGKIGGFARELDQLLGSR